MPKITEKTLLPKDLSDEIMLQIKARVKRGVQLRKAITLGVQRAVEVWRSKNVDKSGG